MANITKKGRELAAKLAQHGVFDGRKHSPSDITEACSLIARHATSLHHVYEAVCNGHPAMSNPHIPTDRAAKLQERFEAWCDKREKQLETRIAELAKSLPGIKGVRFQGDPRGRPVHLVTKNGRGDSWGEPGAIVV